MTYQERRAQVLALKAQGLTHKQIGERLGVSAKHVSRLSSVRTYETNLRLSREVKQRQRGRCEDCGAETRYAGKANVVSARCHPCAVKRAGEAQRGAGPLQTRALAFIGDGERGYMEIANGCGISAAHVGPLLHRLRRLGLVERPRRGVYRKASA